MASTPQLVLNPFQIIAHLLRQKKIDYYINFERLSLKDYKWDFFLRGGEVCIRGVARGGGGRMAADPPKVVKGGGLNYHFVPPNDNGRKGGAK